MAFILSSLCSAYRVMAVVGSVRLAENELHIINIGKKLTD
jgi:hypothetical protein